MELHDLIFYTMHFNVFCWMYIVIGNSNKIKTTQLPVWEYTLTLQAV